MDEKDHFLDPVWATSSSCSHDYLDENLPSNEDIIKAMNDSDRAWDDMHNRSYFLLELARICWACVIFFARVVVSECLCRARRGAKPPAPGFRASAPEIFFSGRHISRTTYFRDDILPGRHISGTT
jgi:hypothetical protein